MTPFLSRRTLLLGTALLATRPAMAAQSIRIGYQKNGSLVILRRQATLEKLFAPRGIGIEWNEFNAGPPLLEALGAGAVDVGATGDTPPIFAQAAGNDIRYIGAQPLPGDNQAVIIRDGGPIHQLGDLKGRRIAYTRGSSAHNLFIKTLERAGLKPSDVQSVPMQPSDAAAAFRNGAIDAWSIWDPFLAIAQQDPATRVLVTSSQVAPTNNFIIAGRGWVGRAPDQVQAFLDAINGAASWAAANPEALAALMTDVTGVPLAAERVAAPRGVYAVQPLDDKIIAQQQDIADTFASLHIIPARIDVRKAVWTPVKSRS
jgi:aliphatic sulfonates family ABC transporter substrate-binding protein